MPGSTSSSQFERPVFRGLSFVGGHAALDFVNTVKYRGAIDPQDKLTSLTDIIAWSQLAAVLSATESGKLAGQKIPKKSAEHICRDTCSFREDVRVVLDKSQSSTTRHERAASRVERAIARLRPVARIDRVSGELERYIEVRSADDLLARIVASVAEILTDRANLRIKTCRGSDCDWLFVDRTKAGRRQWCDTRTCGNVARVRRFRNKH